MANDLLIKFSSEQNRYVMELEIALSIKLQQLENVLQSFFGNDLPDITHSYRIISPRKGNQSLKNIDDIKESVEELLRDIEVMDIEKYQIYSTRLNILQGELSIISAFNDELLVLQDLIQSGERTQSHLLKLISNIVKFNNPAMQDFRQNIIDSLDEFLSMFEFEVGHNQVEWEIYLLNYVESHLDRLMQSKKGETQLQDIEDILLEISALSEYISYQDTENLKTSLKTLVSQRIDYLNVLIQNDIYDSISEEAEIEMLFLQDYFNQLKLDLKFLRKSSYQERLETEIDNSLKDLNQTPIEVNDDSYSKVKKLAKKLDQLLRLKTQDQWIRQHSIELLNLFSYFISFYQNKIQTEKINRSFVVKYNGRIVYMQKLVNVLEKLNNEG